MKSCSSISLDCGHSPLWVWYAEKYWTSERASLHTNCGSVWNLLFLGIRPIVPPFTLLKCLFWHSSSFFSKIWQLLRSKGRKNRLCEISQINLAFKYEFSHESPLHRVFSKAVLGEAVRAWSFKYTEESSVKQPSKSRCCKIRVLPSFSKQNCTDGDLCLSRENKSPEWASKLGQENRHWKYL